MLLKLNEITLIEGNRARAKIKPSQVTYYAGLMKDGAIFPPIIVFGEENILSDGWHRFYANQSLKKTEITAERKSGGAREAQLYSFEANNHGLPPTTKERKANARVMLNDPEWSQWSDLKIAKHTGLDRTTVWRMRKTKTVAKQQVPRKPAGASTPGKPSQEPQETVDDSQIQELSDTISELQDEVVSLRDIVASKRWDASEIEQEDLLDTVKELRKQIEILEMENQTLRGSRDMYQNRCAELIQINKSLQNKLKKVA